MPFIRPKVVCLLRNAGRILLIQAHDPQDGRNFLFPPGGGVEFGETLEQAIRREILEEIGIQLPGVSRIGMFENMFQFAGVAEHELVFVFEAECHDAGLCASKEVTITESNGATFSARWHTLAGIASSELPLFPEGLLELLNLDSESASNPSNRV